MSTKTSLMQRLHPRRRRGRAGGAAIEFALWLPVMMTVASGIIDTSWMMSRYHQVTRAARDAARVGISVIEPEDVAPGSMVSSAAEDHAQAVLNGVGMGCPPSTCVTDATIINTGGRDYLRMDVQWEYEPLMGLLPLNTTLRSTFTMMLQQQD
ncbi:MAG: TadE family protein [Myxococcota bacterium]